MTNKFIINIIVPAIITVALYFLSFYLVLLPLFEKSMMDRKKEMIKELTNSAWSILQEYHYEAENNILAREQAKQKAIERVKYIRYGNQGKDYFWLINKDTMMIMHPYRPALDSTDLSGYRDAQGTKLFVEAVNTVNTSGQGYIDYWWQWKDDSTRIVPKLSYVRLFEPWGWIVGTGIYIEDVNQEISLIKGRVTRITIIILLLIILFTISITRHSLKIEKKRKQAEELLRQSRLKYKSLVDASTDSMMMYLNNKMIYFNRFVSQLTGFNDNELGGKKVEDLIRVSGKNIRDLMDGIGKTTSLEGAIQKKDGDWAEVVITMSRVEVNHKKGHIFIIKELSRQQKQEKISRELDHELESLLILNHTLAKNISLEVVNISMDQSIADALALMKNNPTKAILVTDHEGQPLGTVDIFSILESGLMVSADKTPVSRAMRSPVPNASENILVIDILNQMCIHKTDYLYLRDPSERITGIIDKDIILQNQANPTLQMITSIANAHLTSQLQDVFDKLPSVLRVLVNTGIEGRALTKLISTIADKMVTRVVDLAIKKHGQPPCRFAFFVLGSEGRLEQTLKTDQDNAIVFDGDKSHQEYFLKLAKTINTNLHEIGYKRCKGEIMASNPKWCLSLADWKLKFRHWVEDSDPESVLGSSIFFDLRHVFGQESLVGDLINEIKNATDAKAVFFHHMAEAVKRYKPVSLPGKHETLDLKKAMMPVTGLARLYSLKNNCLAQNTIERLEYLADNDFISPELGHQLVEAYAFLTRSRVKNQLGQIQEKEPPLNMVSMEQLSELEKAQLKTALSIIAQVPTQLSFDFKGMQ